MTLSSTKNAALKLDLENTIWEFDNDRANNKTIKNSFFILLFPVFFNYNAHCDLTLVSKKVDPMFPKLITKSILESLGKIAEEVFLLEIDI